MLTEVEELIDPHTGQWDEALICDVLSSVDVWRILGIPLNVQLTENFVSWNYTRSGTFSVMSAYHKEFDHQFGSRWTREDGQGSVTLNNIWKDVCRLRIPGKIKHFL